MTRSRRVRWISTRRVACAAALLSLAASAAGAQAIRGTVVRADDRTPATGDVVQIIDARSRAILTQARVGQRGTFLVPVPAGSSITVRVLRVGFHPATSGPHAVARDTVDVRVVLPDARIMLAQVDIRASRQCLLRPDSGQLVATLFDQARTALLSSTLADDERRLAEIATFDRIENTRGGLLVPVEWRTRAGSATRPFHSLSADSLARTGYVVTSGDSVEYFAPEAETLLSDAFVRGHCLQVVDGSGERQAWIGIRFRPSRAVRNYVDIAGVLWLDRSTLELRELEYGYEPLPVHLRSAGLGGRVEFTHLASGGWLVHRWSIRMPRVAMRRPLQAASVPGDRAVGMPVVEGLHVVGGEVRRLSIGNVTLYYSTPTADSAATVPNRVSAVEDSVLDALFPACRGGGGRDYVGMVQGRVLSSTRRGVADVAVQAEWNEEFRQTAAGWTWRSRTLSSTSTAGGLYLLCGLPVARPVAVTARWEGQDTRPATVRVKHGALRASADLSWRAGLGPP